MEKHIVTFSVIGSSHAMAMCIRRRFFSLVAKKNWVAPLCFVYKLFYSRLSRQINVFAFFPIGSVRTLG